jgi:hypothetical protein
MFFMIASRGASGGISMRDDRFVRGGLAGAVTVMGIALAAAQPVAATPVRPAAAARIHPGTAAAEHARWTGVGRVRIGGRQAALLGRCLADARDGVVTTQRPACRQVAPAAGLIRLAGSSVQLTGRVAHRRQAFTRAPVTVGIAGGAPRHIDVNITLELSGGSATAVSNCINDAQDGVIQTQRNSCIQYTSAGNIIMLDNVTFVINL